MTRRTDPIARSLRPLAWVAALALLAGGALAQQGTGPGGTGGGGGSGTGPSVVFPVPPGGGGGGGGPDSFHGGGGGGGSVPPTGLVPPTTGGGGGGIVSPHNGDLWDGGGNGGGGSSVPPHEDPPPDDTGDDGSATAWTPAGTLVVVVRDVRGAPVKDIVLTVRAADGRLLGRAITDARGLAVVVHRAGSLPALWVEGLAPDREATEPGPLLGPLPFPPDGVVRIVVRPVVRLAE